MREEYTPTTEAVRRDYIFAQGSNDTGEQRLEGEEFDRWLAQHDAEVFQRIRDLHVPEQTVWGVEGVRCGECGWPLPCRTLLALDGEQE